MPRFLVDVYHPGLTYLQVIFKNRLFYSPQDPSHQYTYRSPVCGTHPFPPRRTSSISLPSNRCCCFSPDCFLSLLVACHCGVRSAFLLHRKTIFYFLFRCRFRFSLQMVSEEGLSLSLFAPSAEPVLARFLSIHLLLIPFSCFHPHAY